MASTDANPVVFFDINLGGMNGEMLSRPEVGLAQSRITPCASRKGCLAPD